MRREREHRKPPPTPNVIVDAIMHAVRERGLAALKEAANLERLSRCDEAAKAEINRRIGRLIAAKEETPA
jgi:hypothetical protein